MSPLGEIVELFEIPGDCLVRTFALEAMIWRPPISPTLGTGLLSKTWRRRPVTNRIVSQMTYTRLPAMAVICLCRSARPP